MIDAVLAKVFGTKNKREIKAIQPLIAAINDLEPAVQQFSDIDLTAKTIEFKEKLAQGAPLDDCSSKPLPWSAKPAAASSTCAIST
jgi:preprotein translocase subunit SecA